jgi:hypothetical protein
MVTSNGGALHGEDLVLDPKCRLAPGFHFMSFWKTQAELAEAGEGAWRINLMLGCRPRDRKKRRKPEVRRSGPAVIVFPPLALLNHL